MAHPNPYHNGRWNTMYYALPGIELNLPQIEGWKRNEYTALKRSIIKFGKPTDPQKQKHTGMASVLKEKKMSMKIANTLYMSWRKGSSCLSILQLDKINNRKIDILIQAKDPTY